MRPPLSEDPSALVIRHGRHGDLERVTAGKVMRKTEGNS